MSIRELQRLAQDFHDSSDGEVQRLRLRVAALLIRRLRQKGWSQKQLARAAGKHESFISRILHGDGNCSLDTIGTLFHALGAELDLQIAGEPVAAAETTGDLTIARIATSAEGRFKYGPKVPETGVVYRTRQDPGHPVGHLQIAATNRSR